MNFNLPFYGYKGTIKSILEDDNCYVVYRYDFDGKNTIVSRVSKNDKNLKLLVENFYADLKGYLDICFDKYEVYKNVNDVKEYDDTLLKALVLLVVVMIGMSIPMLFSFETLGMVGIVLDILSIPVLLTTISFALKNSDCKKKKFFVDEYQKLVHSYNLYNEERIKKHNITKYKGLEKNNPKNKVIEFNFVKELKKANN